MSAFHFSHRFDKFFLCKILSPLSLYFPVMGTELGTWEALKKYLWNGSTAVDDDRGLILFFRVRVHQSFIILQIFRGRLCGRVVKFARSDPAAQGSDPGRGHGTACQVTHVEAASHIPQLEGPATKIYNYVRGGGRGWGDKAEKKRDWQQLLAQVPIFRKKRISGGLNMCKMQHEKYDERRKKNKGRGTKYNLRPKALRTSVT